MELNNNIEVPEGFVYPVFDSSPMVEILKINGDLSVSEELIDPVSITLDFTNEYLNQLNLKSTQNLQDDLSMIWLSLPNEGYINKVAVLRLRQILIEELNSRPPITWRSRLEYRLKLRDNNGI